MKSRKIHKMINLEWLLDNKFFGDFENKFI